MLAGETARNEGRVLGETDRKLDEVTLERLDGVLGRAAGDPPPLTEGAGALGVLSLAPPCTARL